MREQFQRILLGILAAASALIGVWAGFAPRSFYGDFPGTGNPWVSLAVWDQAQEQVYVDCRATWVDDEAEKARILAQSFGQDTGFATYYRTLKAYENSLANPESVLVLSPDSDFFRYFEQGPGR